LLDNLRSRYDHPTADAIYEDLRVKFPKVSLGTVYRNLALLCGTGELRKISCGDGIERYDYNTSDHSHFVCTSCGKVLDLESDSESAINKMAASSEIGKVDSHSLIFYGCCRECMKTNK